MRALAIVLCAFVLAAPVTWLSCYFVWAQYILLLNYPGTYVCLAFTVAFFVLAWLGFRWDANRRAYS